MLRQSVTIRSAAWLRTRLGRPDTIVVDVRGNERAGGWIKGSWDVPYPLTCQTADVLSQLVSEAGASVVVFHCMFSQLRGPACARVFADRVAKTEAVCVETCVLKGGFTGWLAAYLEEEPDLIEGFDPRLWQRQGGPRGEYRHTSEGPYNRRISEMDGVLPGEDPGAEEDSGALPTTSWASVVQGGADYQREIKTDDSALILI